MSVRVAGGDNSRLIVLRTGQWRLPNFGVRHQYCVAHALRTSEPVHPSTLSCSFQHVASPTERLAMATVSPAKESVDMPEETPRDDAAQSTYGFAIALSGGGHRASVLAMGGLVAIVDREMNSRVEVISSVSGGSLTNAAVAAAEGVDYTTITTEKMDELATDFLATIRDRSLLSPLKLAAVAAVLAGLVEELVRRVLRGAGVWSGHFSGTNAIVDVVVALGAFLTALLMVGWVLVYNIWRRHLRQNPRLKDISSRRAAHEFCTTDLREGAPVIFSSNKCEVRRWTSKQPSRLGWNACLKSVPDVSLASIVRASAAFPGIAPKRFNFGREFANHGSTGAPDCECFPETAYCADGGVWNNLGTQAVREGGNSRGLPVLCINASAPDKPAAAWTLVTPFSANVIGLARVMKILNLNTVEPRVDTIERELGRRWRMNEAPNTRDDPLTVIANMDHLQDAFDRIAGRQQLKSKDDDAGRSAVTVDEISALRASSFSGLFDQTEMDKPIKTALARLPSHEIRYLFQRGYIATWLASLYVQPLRAGEVTDAAVADLARRFETIAGKEKPKPAQGTRPSDTERRSAD